MNEPQLRKAQGIAPRPPREEFERRLENVYTALNEHDVDGVVIYGTGPTPDPIRYLTGYVHPFPRARSLLILPRRAEPILLIDREWHRADADRMTWIDDVRTIPTDFHSERDALRRALEAAIADTGLDGGVVALPDLDLPASLWQALTDLPEVAELPLMESMWSTLVTEPTAYDVERIEETAAIADAGLEAFVSACRPGVTEREVCFEAMETMAELGAEFIHGNAISTHVDVGSFSRGRSNLQPFLHTETELRSGELFWVDLIVCNDGYYVDCDRTISIGEPSTQQRALYETCREMYEAMLERIEPGVSGHAVWEAGHEIARTAGRQDRLNGIYLGHSTGITISSSPTVQEGESRKLRSGQFLNIEPGLFVPEIGGACLENTIRVDETGGKPINEMDIDLQVVR